MADNLARSLSDATVRNAKPKTKPYKLTDGGGLFMLVQTNGAKLWRYKFRLNGREGLHAIGAYPDVNLSLARLHHRAAREQVAAGQNPVHIRQAERERAEQERLRAEAGAFENVVRGWRELTDPNLAPGSIRQREREINKYLVPEFKARTIDAITRADVARVVKRVEARAREVARNLRTYMDAVFEYAIDVGLVAANPVPPPRSMKRRRQRSHKAMDADQVGEFLRKVRGCTAEIETRTAMQLVILAACRKAEATAARWCEFDLDAASWTIPAERMKARREHWVPLPRQAVAMLRQLREVSAGELLFPHRDRAGAPMAERTLNMLLFRLGYHGETVHGFRSVFSTRYNAASAANADVVERCLAHAPKDAVRAAYNRHDYAEERRVLLQDWADWLDAQAADERQPQQLAA